MELSLLYHKLKERGFFGEPKDRPLLDEVLKVIDEQLINDSPSLTFVQLPPGYGKTAVPFSLALWSVLSEETPIERSIHVLPLRAIVEDVNARFTGYGQNAEGGARGLRAFGISKKDAENISGAQCMFIHGSPFLQKNGFLSTTLDTFTLLASKLPTLEISKISREDELYGHYEIARGAILSSVTIFDEAHLFFEEHRGSERASEALIALMVALLKWRIPIIMMTATLPSSLREEIMEWVKDFIPKVSFNVLEYGRKGRIDDGFEEEVRSVKLKTKLEKDEEEYINLIRQAYSTYDRVLVVANTVYRSIDLFNKLEDLEPILLHAKFTQRDRMSKLNKLKKDRWLCISTQVIEAGVDISSDVLFTDIAPICSIVQRTGRCCRPSHRTTETGGILICMSKESMDAAKNVYEENRIEATCEELINIIKIGKDFHWHSYLDYFPLIKKIYCRKPDFKFGSIFSYVLNIFENPYYESTDALDRLLELGSFTRSNLLMPAIICEKGEIKELKDLQDRSLFMPIEEDDLIKICKKSEVRILLKKKDDKIEEKPIDEKGMKDMVKRMIIGEVLGFGISNRMYDEKRGLKLWA